MRDPAPCAQAGRLQGFREKDLPMVGFLGWGTPTREEEHGQGQYHSFHLGDLEEKRGLAEWVGLWHGGTLYSPTHSRQERRKKVLE